VTEISNDFEKDIQFDLISPAANVNTHTQALELLSEHAAEYLSISQKRIFKRIGEKEAISNPAIGEGIAIPHAKMHRVQMPFTMLMTTQNKVTWETPDDKPLDIYCLLISPISEGPVHLRRLSRISRLLKNKSLLHRVRDTQDTDVIRSLLMDPNGWLMAA